MRKFIKGCLGVAAALLAANFALAEVNAGVFSDCSPCKEVSCDPCEPVCGKKSGWEWGGWMEAGIYSNQYGQRNVYVQNGAEHNLRPFSGNTILLNNVRQSDFQMNQLWLYLGKKLDTRHGFDFGGRIDAVYGTDAVYTQSQGLEYTTGNNRRWGDGDYYGSFAQMYAEAGYKNTSVKVGKFITPMGHEGIMSTERFFYSLSYQFAALPVTHTGALATWSPSKNLSVFGGWVNGQNAFDQDLTFYNADNNAALLGIKYTRNKVTLAYSAMIGQDTTYGDYYYSPSDYMNGKRDYFVQSVVVNVKPNKRWDYTFEWTLRNHVADGVEHFQGDDYRYTFYDGAYGINQELIYRFNKKWAVGIRGEWMHLYGDGDATNAYEVTFGANWTPTKWLLIRPELRYDKVYGGTRPFNNFGYDGDVVVNRPDPRNEQFSGGVSAVVKF